MLSARRIFDGEGVRVWDVACRHGAGRGSAAEHAGGHAVVFVRRGCFVRSADGVDAVLDPTVAYCMNPGEEQRFDHPHGHGDDCTSVALDAHVAAGLWGGDPALPGGALPVAPALDLEHRLLLAESLRGDDVSERALGLVARTLEAAGPRRVASGRPATARARRALADAAREALAERPERSLVELARLLAVSPHHLSRVFRTQTGHTIARHRMRLRVRAALDRLGGFGAHAADGGGSVELARLAFELGFADQAHMTRVVRAETGATPSALRAALSDPRT
jgi:AraC-like DNA-binding protein